MTRVAVRIRFAPDVLLADGGSNLPADATPERLLPGVNEPNAERAGVLLCADSTTRPNGLCVVSSVAPPDAHFDQVTCSDVQVQAGAWNCPDRGCAQLDGVSDATRPCDSAPATGSSPASAAPAASPLLHRTGITAEEATAVLRETRLSSGYLDRERSSAPPRLARPVPGHRVGRRSGFVRWPEPLNDAGAL